MDGLKKLYQRKIDILQEVLTLTTATTFNGTGDDADEYISLMEKRNVLFADMAGIDREMEKASPLSDPSSDSPEIKQLKQTITSVASKIVDYDNVMREKTKLIQENLRHEIKGINEGRNLNSVYNNSIVAGSSYDWSK